MGFFEELNPGKGIPFMDGREKGDTQTLAGKEWHISDFGFIKGDNGEFAVAIFEEDAERFYFLNNILTEMLQKVAAAGKRDELPAQRIRFEVRPNKQGKREYMTFEFVGEDEIPF